MLQSNFFSAQPLAGVWPMHVATRDAQRGVPSVVPCDCDGGSRWLTATANANWPLCGMCRSPPRTIHMPARFLGVGMVHVLWLRGPMTADTAPAVFSAGTPCQMNFPRRVCD